MQINWKQRLNQEPHLSDISTWPHISLHLIPKKKRSKFLRNKKIINSVLSGNSIKDTGKEYGISSARISQLLNRCLSTDESETPPLNKALIPGSILRPGERTKALSSFQNPSGSRGAFTFLLKNVENLKQKLDEIIISSVSRKSYSQNITPKYFHKEFLRLLNDQQYCKDTYPFNQSNLGYESCRKYLKKRIQELKTPEVKPEREIVLRKKEKIPYQEIQIDAQIQDINTHLNIEFNGHVIPLRLSRVTLFLATDVATGCHLAYHLCLTKDPTQLDLLNLLQKIHQPWEEIEFNTPGLKYEKGACLPSSLNELNKYTGAGVIRLDNALCHMSNMVKDYVCNTLCATLNFGLPAQPKGRNYIEHAFKLLNENIHRIPSTTGSNPNDPLKETKANSKKLPVVSINAYKEILEVLITGHNVKPRNALGSLSPLDSMRNKIKDYVPLCCLQIEKSNNPFLVQKVVQVKCIEKENRSPHINFEGNRYKGNCINNSLLVGTKVIIEYDTRDLRHLSVNKLTGENIGKIDAPKSWQNYAFSIGTLKKIKKINRKQRLLGLDPLSGYFEYLLKNKELPKQATELLRVYEEYSSGKISIFDNGSKNDKKITLIKQTKHKKKTKNLDQAIPEWSPKFAQREY